MVTVAPVGAETRLYFCNKHKHDRSQFIRILDLRDSTQPKNQPLETLNSEIYPQYSIVYSLYWNESFLYSNL